MTDIAAKYGLFVALVVYVLYENRQREAKYLQVIDTLTNKIYKKLENIEKRNVL